MYKASDILALPLHHQKGKKWLSLRRKHVSNQIFYYLVKDKQIKFLEGQKLPLAEEMKRKKYCKWHHSWTCTTVNCTVIRNAILKALNEGRLKLAEKGEMIVESNLFRSMPINMVSILTTHKQQKKRIPKWE